MTRARGADVSAFQAQAQVRTLAHHGLAFAFVKATEGDTYVSPAARWQISVLEAAGLVVGLYHFLDHGIDGATQWDHFEQHARLASGPIACDQETDSHDVLVPDAIAAAFIRRAHQRGFKVGRYGDSRVMRRNLGEDWRWAAWWAKTPPPYHWDVWQFTSSGGEQDYDVFRGDVNQLRAWSAAMRPDLHRKPTPPPLRWWLHDDFAKQAHGPYRLPALGAATVTYLARHPRTAGLRLVRK